LVEGVRRPNGPAEDSFGPIGKVPSVRESCGEFGGMDVVGPGHLGARQGFSIDMNGTSFGIASERQFDADKRGLGEK